MKKIWRFLSALFSYLFISLHLYRLNSILHRIFNDGRWEKVQISTFHSLQELGAFMSPYPYKHDGVFELGDAICTPNKVEAVLQARDPVVAGSFHGNDCDEMGIYQVAAIKKSLAAGLLKSEGVVDAFLFTVMWMEGMKGAGHNLTVIKYADGDYQVLDYGSLGMRSNSLDVLAKNIRLKYVKGAESLGWYLSDARLRPVRKRLLGP